MKKESTVKFHTTKTPTWTNASGDPVPFKYVPADDKLKEVWGSKIYKAALVAEKALADLHAMMNEALEEIRSQLREAYSIKHKGKALKEGKGCLTWFNFNRSLKVEAEVNDIVKWDGSLMTEAHLLLTKYINGSISEDNELIKGLVGKAFSNSKNMIDTSKVFQILSYQDKIKNTNYQKACELMKKAQSIDRTKLYQRVWEKSSNGEYRNINLNFSSI